jgi:hypothetical protein
LRQGDVAVTEFRAAVIIGSGSISFEMIRYLTERIPLLICPRWVFTRIQPIAIDDVLAYLVQAPQVPESANCVIEIGGSDVLTYGDMMLRYAEARGLKRRLVPVPLLTPRLSSSWVHLVTPIPAYIARPLIKGLRNEVIVRHKTADVLFPGIVPVDYNTAVAQTLQNVRKGNIETIWSDAQTSSLHDDKPQLFLQEQGMYIERHERWVNAGPSAVYRSFTGLGGNRGWPPYQFLWEIRGWLDRLVGGVGLRRGRRHPSELRVGDAVDFWRVEEIVPNKKLLLRAEMKLPGRAWLQFEIDDELLPSPQMERDQTRVVQTAYFASKGFWGWLYWYSVWPLHLFVFPGMLKAVADYAEQMADGLGDMNAPENASHSPRGD